MAAQSAPKRSYSLKQALVARLASKHGIDPTAAADAGDQGAAILDNVSRAKATKGKEQAKYIAVAQAGLRRLDEKKHTTLINGVQAKLLALQGRGGDTKVAHVTPGELVMLRSVLTPELAGLIAGEAMKQGIDPDRLVVGSQRASVNPETGVEEFFGMRDWQSLAGVGIDARRDTPPARNWPDQFAPKGTATVEEGPGAEPIIPSEPDPRSPGREAPGIKPIPPLSVPDAVACEIPAEDYERLGQFWQRYDALMQSKRQQEAHIEKHPMSFPQIDALAEINKQLADPEFQAQLQGAQKLMKICGVRRA